MRGSLEGTRVPNPTQDCGSFGIDDSFGSRELEGTLGKSLKYLGLIA